MNLKNLPYTIPVKGNYANLKIFDLHIWDGMNSADNNRATYSEYLNEILVFYRGSGIHEIDFVKYPIHNCSIHFVAARQVHKVLYDNDISGCRMLFSNELLSLTAAETNFAVDLILFRNGLIKPVLNLSANEFEDFHAIIEMLKKEFFDNPGLCGDLMRSIFRIFILYAKRSYDNNTPGADKKYCSFAVSKFLALIEKDYIKHYTLNQYASMLNVSPKYLSALCKKYLGKNAYSLVEEKFVLEAKRLLVHTNKTIKEISFALNFEDPAYFTRFFKKETGCTPHQYRENVQ